MRMHRRNSAVCSLYMTMPCCCCCFSTSNKKQAPNLYSRSVGGLSSEKKIKLFSYSELRSATNNFSRSNKIGQGGFGTVYKGTVRSGREVAVKVLSAYSRQGIKEFLTEIDVISNVKHPNLLELLGCCVQGNDHRILVYEFLQNSSLDRALLGSSGDPGKFSWSLRCGICVGVARGLAFLHEELQSPIVHRDIKASNILLDADYAPKIGDFGLAKLFPDNITHISTRVAGTTGYLAPEYAWYGQLTKKADIYSFGVLLLETVTGRSISRSLLSDDKVLVEKTWELYQAGKLSDMIDPALKEQGECPEEEEVVRYMKVALLCTQAAPLRRPSMSQVVEMLSRNGVRVRERELTPPGYVHDYLKVPSSQSQGSADNNSYSMAAPHTVSEVTPR